MEKWIRKEAEKRIGQSLSESPFESIRKEQGGGEATVIVWVWARTVKCPNPACGVNNATRPLFLALE